MIEALAITTSSIVIGVGLGVLTRRKTASFGALRVFAVSAVATAVALQMLPEALTELGGTALLVFLGALVLPGLLNPVLRRVAGTDTTRHALSADLGFLGFLAHQLAEGVALGSFSTGEHAGHGHEGLVLAVAAHTVPLTALLIAEALTHRTRRVAMGRAVALIVATGLGFALADLLHEVVPHALHSWLTAGVAGVLMHILFHDHGEGRPRTVSVRLLESLAVIAGIALPIVAASASGRAMQRSVTDAFVELSLETAPMLLVGLMIGATLQLLGAKLPTRFFTKGGDLRQALRGVAVGAPLPLCACGVLPVAESLRKRGAGPALVVAFLVATPELGPETLTLTLRFMGGPYAGVRIIAALALAVFAGWWFGRVVRKSGRGERAVEPSTEEELGASAQAFAHFDELLLHVGPWAFVGLWAAAFVQVGLPEGSLAQTTAAGFDIWLVASVAMPAYVCAASATPVAAVLLLKGISPGAVLVGLLLGPATNVATLGVLKDAYGGRSVLLGTLGIALVTIGLGYAVNAIDVPVMLPSRLDHPHEHGWLSWGSTIALALALGWQMWRWGLGPWLEVLGGHAHADHGHGHHHHHHHAHGHHDHAHHEHEHPHG